MAKLQFDGSASQFWRVIENISYRVKRTVSSTVNRADLDRGVVVNYWPSTGTVLFQGPPVEADRMRLLFARKTASLAWLDD
jgi:hypothetical protein